jgi:hypothetical protein
MKLVITESQLKALITEQTKPTLTAQSAYASAPTTSTGSGTINSTQGKGTGIIDTVKDVGNLVSKLDPHTVAMVGQIAASILIPPPGGLIVAAAIGVGDAYRYHAEKNDKMAGVTLLLAALPGMTKLAAKVPGLNRLGAKGMSILASKVAKGITTLAPEEAAVMNFIKNNTKLVQQEYNAFVTTVSSKIAKNAASFGSSKAVNAAYDYAYDNPEFAKKLAFGVVGSVMPGIGAAGNVINQMQKPSSAQIAANGINAGASPIKKA